MILVCGFVPDLSTALFQSGHPLIVHRRQRLDLDPPQLVLDDCHHRGQGQLVDDQLEAGLSPVPGQHVSLLCHPLPLSLKLSNSQTKSR
jgi:hypothetical protein